ncbi:MAG TPA: glycosyltransferase family 4 protein [Nitrospira sp.]|nr:glycosyltransferase family 4 protein [Nitrospira sp.]
MHTVCHIITKLELGGAQQNTLFTVSHLDRARFRPALITGEPGILDAEARNIPGLMVFQVPSLKREIDPVQDSRALWSLAAVLRRLRPTIVHTHSSKAGILGRAAAYLTGVPIVIHTIHGYGVTPAQHPVLRWLLLALERACSRATTRFFAVSEANRRQGIEWRLFSPDRCAVLRSGVDLAALRRTPVDKTAKRRDLGLDPLRPVVGMVAPLKPQKAPIDFVTLAALVRRWNPNVQFVLVGDGELRAAVEAESARLGVGSALRLLGWRRDVPEIMKCLDVFVLTSRWEGLPRAYLEALACGVPVVGTRVDGAEEVVFDGRNGFLVAPGDVEAMAEKVQLLLAHPEIVQPDAFVLPAEFDIHDMIKRQEREYQRLIDAGIGRREPTIDHASTSGSLLR